MMRRAGARIATLAACVSLLILVSAQARAQSRDSRPSGANGPREAVEPLAFTGSGHTFHGDWQASVLVSTDSWRRGQALRADVSLTVGDGHLGSLAAAGIKADRICLLVTAERTFDADGWMRLASDERMSTLLTPGGLAIEGGVQGAATNRYGYAYRAPLDQFVSLPVSSLAAGTTAGTREAAFSVNAVLPGDLPPGLYRLRLDFGVMAGTRLYNINGFAFAVRPFSSEAGTSTYFYSPVIPASGIHASGRVVDGRRIRPTMPWLLLASYNSNGYRGVVADEDRRRFATSDRSIIPDEVILPLFDAAGNRVGYSLEPQFPADTIDPLQNLQWDWTSGELAVRVAGPDGSLVDLGKASFVARAGSGPTTKNARFTAWKPQAYGRYTVTATGWIADREGRRYEGGGTYRFWIARRMTLATATFQGQPYPVGSSYGRDIQFNPAVPADVQVTARLYVDSDATAVRELSYGGRASMAGLFGAAQGMRAFPLDAPGEYHAQVLATYTDAEGHLWVSTMRHAGVVYPESSSIIARGKKLQVAGKYVERGETRFEGHVEPDGEQHLAHVTFPYLAGDLLLIGADGQGANKIEPVLTCQAQGDPAAWDTRLNAVGTTNLRIRTSNDYSPHMYPEYITDWEYYYGAAPRPGFMGRFLVGESTVRAPYWPVSPNSFGGQIGASTNGDAPGDIYRLLGGVVLRPAGRTPLYAGYMASAFLLPKGTNNNRVVAPGSEDLHGPLGNKARFFLVGLRPGTAFEVGSTFRPAVQIDPMLPASIDFVLTTPDGRRHTATGTGDRFGSFVGPTAWPLDVPGVYRYELRGRWNGHEGRMPGLPEQGGHFFVYSKSKPAGSAGLAVEGPSQRTFSAGAGTTITGRSSAEVVHYTVLTPGAVIDQGEIPVRGGRFQYVFDPAAVNQRVPLYDIRNITTGQPQIGRVIHLTFFSEEHSAGGSFFDVARVLLRGTTVIASRAVIPLAQMASVIPPSSAGGGVSSPVGTTAVANWPASGTEISASGGSVGEWDARVSSMVRSGVLRLDSGEPDTLVPGRFHERFQQYHEGVPVFGANITRQSWNGRAVSIFGVLQSNIRVAATPAVSEEVARGAIERLTGGRIVDGRFPELVVLAGGEGRFDLAWWAEARTGTDVLWCFLDAGSGRLLRQYSNLQRQDPRASPARGRVADLRGDASRTVAVLSGTLALRPSDLVSAGTSADRTAARTAAHLDAVFDHYRERLGRDGLDGRGRPVTAIVHPGDLPCFSKGFWDGRHVVVGQGAEVGTTIAHEVTHAVIAASSRLIYGGESGALNEAFADIIGVSVAFDARAIDRGQADYTVGSGDAARGERRSLEDPASLGQPDHLDRRVVGDADNGGVHLNATIAGHAYFLAVEGGTNRTSQIVVEGAGRHRRHDVERAFYRAFVHLLPSSATFPLARAASIQAARDLYGADGDVERAVAAAWAAVGVR